MTHVPRKPSGVPWLGDVPAHWEVVRLKVLVALVTTKAERHDWRVALENIESGTGRYVATESEYEGEGIAFQPNDLLFGKLRPYLAKVLLVERSGEAVGDFYVMRPREKIDSEFLKFLLLSPEFINIVDGSTFGSKMPRASWDFVGAMPIPLPPLAEQQAIAAYLDRETARIDALAADQRRLIALLHEKRRAVIAHAVTQGLDPAAPRKPSGVEWLGDVPAHWEVVRNKVVFSERDERSENEDGELLTVSHITGVTPRAEKDVNMFLAETLEGYKVCLAGDLVINTMWAWMGALGSTKQDGLVSPSYNVYKVRNSSRLNSSYYDYLCRVPSHRIAMKAESKGVWESRLRLYPDAFLAMSMPLPPLAEQQAIAAYLDRETARIDALTAEAERAIALLQERRAALISEAVTGRL
jgi:type I restriction enzyme S subunit